MPDQPSQLPKQQFSAANADTRSQTRISRLEERVRQLEQGKHLLQVPSFRWDQPSTVTNTTSISWTIDIPLPSGRASDPLKTQYGDLIIWFRLPLAAVAGAASGNIVLTGADTQTWTYSLPLSGSTRTYSPAQTAAAAETTYDSNLGSQTGKSGPVMMPFVTSGPWAPTNSLTLQVTKTAGAGTGVTVSGGVLYAIIPTTSTS